MPSGGTKAKWPFPQRTEQRWHSSAPSRALPSDPCRAHIRARHRSGTFSSIARLPARSSRISTAFSSGLLPATYKENHEDQVVRLALVGMISGFTLGQSEPNINAQDHGNPKELASDNGCAATPKSSGRTWCWPSMGVKMVHWSS